MDKIKQILLIFLFSIVSGCQEYVEIQQQNGVSWLSGKAFKIEELSSIPWKLGNNRSKIVSRGFRVLIDLPVIKDDDLESLYKKRGIDSWLVRISRGPSMIGSENTMGFLYVPLFNSRRRINQVKKFAFQVEYAAAYLAGRYQKEDCPLMGHRYLINNLEGILLSFSNSEEKKIFLNVRKKIQARVDKAQLFPSSLNGGKNLFGDYFVELALFDSKESVQLSSFVPLDRKINVGLEKIVPIPECNNFKPKLRKENDNFKKFQFGN